MIIRETTEPDPRVEAVARKAECLLKEAGISYSVIGGLQLNRLGVGRPTLDIDLVVPKSRWQEAVTTLESLSIDHERMGLPGEPQPSAILRSREGPFLEIFPQGLTAGDVARLRGKFKYHPAAQVPMKARGHTLINLINTKLASHLCATDRLQDLSDIQRLINHLHLDQDLAPRLDPRVRSTFRKLLSSADG